MYFHWPREDEHLINTHKLQPLLLASQAAASASGLDNQRKITNFETRHPAVFPTPERKEMLRSVLKSKAKSSKKKAEGHAIRRRGWMQGGLRSASKEIISYCRADDRVLRSVV